MRIKIKNENDERDKNVNVNENESENINRKMDKDGLKHHHMEASELKWRAITHRIIK